MVSPLDSRCTFQHGYSPFNYNKKAQLSLANPRDACEKLHGLRKSSGVVVSCIASLLIDSVPMVYYYVLYSNCKMRRFGDTRLLKLP